MDIKSKKGVTLVEVVVAVAIMAIIMVPISLVFNTAYTNFIVESDKVAAQQGAREVLYGKGMNSYGVMGDLERSNATASDDLIKIEDPIVLGSPNKGRSISITEVTDAGNGQTKKYYYEFDVADDSWKLKYKIIYPDGSTSEDDYFANATSSNNRQVKVTGFEVEKKAKGADIDTDPDPAKVTIIDKDVIKITVTVACGKSGDITLQSSYRIPNIEG